MTIPRPPEPPTLGIDRELRTAIIGWAEVRGCSADALWAGYAAHEGYGTIPGALSRIGQRYALGGALHDAFLNAIRELATREHAARGGLTIEPSIDDATTAAAHYAYREALFLIPDEEFLACLECAPLLMRKFPATSWMGKPTVIEQSVLTYAGGLFERRGLPWQASQHGGISWVGDRAQHDETVRPALVVLGDSRLAAAATQFTDALAARRGGDQASRIKTLNAARRSVEAALGALLRDRCLEVPGQVTKNVNALVAGGVIDRWYQPLLEATAHIANKLGAHDATDGRPQYVPGDAVDAAIASAATAISFVGGRLTRA